MSTAHKIVLGLVLFSVTACASLEKPKPAKAQSTIPPSPGLQAQELAIGECGIFLWSKSLPRTFVFFQKQGGASAKYYQQDTEITLQTNQNTNNMSDSGELLIDYTGAEYMAFTIKGQFTDIIEGGLRISNATIKSKKPDTWEEIQPVSGVFVCR